MQDRWCVNLSDAAIWYSVAVTALADGCSLVRIWLLLPTQFGPTLEEMALAAERSLLVDQDLCHLFPARLANDNARHVFWHWEFLSTWFPGVPRIPSLPSSELCVWLPVRQ